MKGRHIKYHHEQAELEGYLVGDDGRTGAPGILLAHEATGLNDRCRKRAERYAKEGFVVFALDLYGEHEIPIERSIPMHEELLGTPDLLLARAQCGLDVLKSLPEVDENRITALGYCQGGITALELARAKASINCAIGIHPGLKRPAGSRSSTIDAKILMIVGNSDPVVPEEDRKAFIEEMEATGADWQLHLLGGVGHTFSNPDVDVLGLPGFAYDQVAAERAWNLSMDLMRECNASNHGLKS